MLIKALRSNDKDFLEDKMKVNKIISALIF